MPFFLFRDKIKSVMDRKIFKKFNKKKAIDSFFEKNDDPFLVKEGEFKFGQLKDSFYYTDWTEQSFLSDTGGKEILTRTFNFRSLKYFYSLMLIIFLLIIGRVFWLQVIKNDHYRLLAEGNRLRSEVIEPKRGIVYASKGEALVRNKANFVLYLRPIDLPRNELERDNLIRKISLVLDDNNQGDLISDTAGPYQIINDNSYFYQIKEALSEVKIGSLESYQPLFVADNIDYEKALMLMIDLPSWPGVFLSSKIRREYLLPLFNGEVNVLEDNSLSHVLGYTGKINEKELSNLGEEYSRIDYLGKIGLEYSWEKELKGKAGSKNIEVDALGRQKKIINEIPAQDGYSLLLSLNLELQQKAEEIAKNYLEKTGLSRASIIAINPSNGEVLALVSLPAYNNNLFAGGISQTDYNHFLNDPDQPLFNRAISGEFPSGSTIKPLFAAGALEEGIITERTNFLSTGGLRISEWFFPDWKAGGHGITNVKKAIAESVNTFFYYIGGGYQDFTGLGLDGLIKYSYLFGLGEKTGIDLSGERQGFVPSREWKETVKNEPWYIGDTYHFAIGQGDVIVTPLQVANYTAALANGGTLYRPHLVKQVLNTDNKIIKTIEPEVIRSNFISAENMKIVREGMRQTVTSGSAASLSMLPVSAAGKTGTAQWSSKKSPHAWFIGFAPYDNPEIAIMVLVEEGVEGSTMAAPIAREILNWYFSKEEIIQD